MLGNDNIGLLNSFSNPSESSRKHAINTYTTSRRWLGKTYLLLSSPKGRGPETK